MIERSSGFFSATGCNVGRHLAATGWFTAESLKLQQQKLTQSLQIMAGRE